MDWTERGEMRAKGAGWFRAWNCEVKVFNGSGWPWEFRGGSEVVNHRRLTL